MLRQNTGLPAPGRGNTLVRMDGDAGPFMHWLAETFPKEFDRAVRSQGYWLAGQIKTAMRSGGKTIGQRWADRSLISVYRPIERGQRGLIKKSWKRKKLRNAGSLSAALTTGNPYRRLGRPGHKQAFGSGKMIGRGGVRYNYNPQKMQLTVGFLGRTAPFAKMLQGGLLGGAGSFPFKRRQPVTPAMRRMFWAAGIPIAKETKFIENEPRPLVAPLFAQKENEIVQRVEYRIQAYLRGFHAREASRYVNRLLKEGA
jgi:hypothetical protein